MKKKYSVIPVTCYQVKVNGKISHYAKYKELGQGYAAVMKKGKWGIISDKNEIIIPFEYENIGLLGLEKNIQMAFLPLVVSSFLFLGTMMIGGRRALLELKRRFHI